MIERVTSLPTAGTPRGPSEGEKKAIAWVDPCPHSSVNAPEGQLIDAGEDGIGMYQNYECDSQTGWRTIFVCMQHCPVGAVTTLIQPVQPSLLEVNATVRENAPIPNPLFAPPVELGNNIKAVVGKRLYINLAENSFTEVSKNFSWDATGTRATISGYWYANVLYVPINFEYSVDGQTIGPCPGPGDSGRTEAGRTTLDALGCSAVINDRPASGLLPVTVTTNWLVYINTNIPGVASPIAEQGVATFDVPVKELQAVVIN